jgi:hypothetical protein
MAFERVISSHGRKYRQRVEKFRDPVTGRTKVRILESLGPVRPIYRRAPAPWSAPLLLAHFGLLAARLVTGELDSRDIVQLIGDMGRDLPPGKILAAGIRYDLVKKTPEPLELLLWLEPPSSGRAAAAPPAGSDPAARGRRARPSSRSKGSPP